MPDGLLGLATALVGIPSVSHHEGAMADAVQAALELCPWLDVERVGDNVVARTELGRERRVLLAGHLDTVPPADGNDEPRLEGTTLYGLGSVDMKGGLAVFLHLAGTLREPAVDVTWCFYVGEEVARSSTDSVTCGPCAPTCWPPTPPSWGSRRVAWSRRGARAPCASGSDWPVDGPTPPVPSSAATPSIGSRRS